MPEPLCLLSVHAHPDDESSKGASTIARYHADGVRTVLVTCTGGEEGDILNPAMDLPEIRDHLPEIRAAELADAARIIGYDEVALLGFRDSGMPDTPANADPRNFANAPLEVAVGRLIEVIRRVRPQVIITYDEDQRGYPHPDHLRVHEVTAVAFDQAGDPSLFPEAGEPFTPLKMYYNARFREHLMARHNKFLELGLASPYEERIADGWLDKLSGAEPTTFIDVRGFVGVRQEALLAHRTQIDPTSPHWFGLPSEVEVELSATDSFALARSRTAPTRLPEDDLFAGVRELAEA
jgi:mycothiol S-conjugate amidase